MKRMSERSAPAVSIRILGGLWMSALLVGCGADLQHAELPQQDVLAEPGIQQIDGRASLDISVLIYNVAGLPWPLGCGKRSRQLDESGERIPIACDRSEALAAIGDGLAALRADGRAPNVVMLQEAFIAAAQDVVERGGYANWVVGPQADADAPDHSAGASAEFVDGRSFWAGEKLGKWQSSGLVIASDFPILEVLSQPFYRWECAGFDCLANKGVMLVRLEIPGVPDPLEVATTHFNSRGASGVSPDRALVAHELQVDTVSAFMERTSNRNYPYIWGGDLNMRHSEGRINYFVKRSGDDLKEVSSYCLEADSGCEVDMRWDSGTPWFETQDLQGWDSGRRVAIRPLRVRELFHRPVGSEMPSDHNGLLVDYRLSWSAD